MQLRVVLDYKKLPLYVIDLALAHVSALDSMAVNGGCEAINIGTG
jgi:UDP-glucose 4-epimerase